MLFQASLSVGAPDDPYEQEAEKVSSQVMNNYEQVTSLQRKLDVFGVQHSIQPMTIATRISRKLQRILFKHRLQKKCDECEKEEKMHAKSDRIQFSGEEAVVPAQMESMIQNQRGSGQAMDPITQTAMESSFGADFSSVKIHTDSTAVQMSRDLHAHAFTIGNDIFFNEGRYQPQTKAGAGLLAHELTHVVQQGAAVQNKSVNRLPFSNLFSNNTIAKLSSAGGDATQQARLYRKEIAQFQKEIPEGTLLKQQQQILQSKEVDKVQTQSNAKIMRLYGGGGGSTPPAARKAKLKSGPKYTPNGKQKSTNTPTKKSFAFALDAEFENDPANGIHASCGETRQYIKWDNNAVHPANFGHKKFQPIASFPPGVWHEDRDDVDKRYGHRTGTHAECISVNHYEDSKANFDCANGPIYKGSDTPFVQGSTGFISSWKGIWDFKLEAIDSCNGSKVLGTDLVTVDWN